MRYDESCIQQLLNVVTYVDPRYKKLPFLNESDKRRVLQDVESMVMDHLSVVEEREVEERPSEDIENESSPPSKKKAWSRSIY